MMNRGLVGLRGLLDRLRPTRSAFDLPPVTGNGASDTLRYILANTADDARPRTLISFLGALPPNIGEILESVAYSCRAKGEFPVAVLADLRPELMAVSATPIEFIPTRRHLFVLNADEYQRFVRRRWSLIITKWNFASELKFGASFEEFIETELRGADAISGETDIGSMPGPATAATAYSP
jgi:hypothetical protein